MIDIDVARRLQESGLLWDPVEGDLFTIDTELLRDEAFMLSSMVVEPAVGRGGERVFRFNGTTEWALDSVEQQEAIWIPREDQLRTALGASFRSLHRAADDAYVVTFSPTGGAGSPTGGTESPTGGAERREVRAPHAEDAYAGALLVQLTGG